ncbi:MAG TPA: FAD-dependent monooxygenase, partial [Polyangiales bacterium]|nr:FAD-dependent monooxygenase [Polyangiales bacterium]
MTKLNAYDCDAVIVGAGIGGLAAAIALRQQGLSVRVFERAPEVREVGAGLSLWPNGMSALDRIGLGAAVRRRGVRDLDSALRSSDGGLLVAADSAALERLLGDVSLVIHRAELLAMLHSALPPECVVSSARCAMVMEANGGVRASFDDGSHVHGRFLIGADGLHSTVRSALFGEQPPRYAGYTAWRGVAKLEHRKLRP